jgi:hypothetical protein
MLVAFLFPLDFDDVVSFTFSLSTRGGSCITPQWAILFLAENMLKLSSAALADRALPEGALPLDPADAGSELWRVASLRIRTVSALSM